MKSIGRQIGRRRRWWPAVFVAAMAVLALPQMSATAADEVTTPVAFVDTDALETSCEALAAGESVRLRNETATKQRVRLRFVELSDDAGAETTPARVCGGLAPIEPLTLGPAATGTLTLSATNTEAERFSGLLAALADEGGVARRELSISSEPAAAAVADLNAEPLVSSQSARLEGDARGPIWIPVEAIEEVAAEANSETVDEPQARVVGAVSGPNGPVEVTYDGERRSLGNGAAALGLWLGDLDAGSYSGTVDLLPGDDEAGEVDLSIDVAWAWYVAALLLALGIALGVGVQCANGRYVPRGRLQRRVGGLKRRNVDALAVLADRAGDSGQPGSKAWGEFEIDDLTAIQARLRTRVDRSAHAALVHIDKSVLDALEGQLASVEAQIDLIAAIPDHAEKLEEAVARLRDKRPGDTALPPLRPPTGQDGQAGIEIEAATALEGMALPADELEQKVKAIDLRTVQIGMLQRLELRLSHLWKARGELDAALDGGAPAEIDKELVAIRLLLWTARGDEDLESAAKEIQSAAKEIADRWIQMPEKDAQPSEISKLTWSPPPELPPGALGFAIAPGMSGGGSSAFTRRVQEAISAAAGTDSPGVAEPSEAPVPPPPLPPLPPSPPLSDEQAERQVRKARVAQFIVVLIAAIAALGTGLGALYVGKAWGSTWDALAAIVWGLAAQATVLALATSIDDLSLRSTRS